MKLRTILMAAAAYGACLSYSAAASAQDTGKDHQIETVVVTSYFDKGSVSASKLDVPARDVPFSTTSYSKDFLNALETTNVSDLYRYMTGVQRAGNTGYDMVIRGFKTGGNDKNAIMVDGLPGLTVRFGSPPTVGVDHMEVVKGPASILYGQAQPGGFVNIITKKPIETQQEIFKLIGTNEERANGSAWGVDAWADITGPIDEEGKFLYRIIGEIGDIDHFRTGSYERPVYLAPSVTWNIDDNTSATVQLEYRHLIDSYDTYLVAPNLDIKKIASIYTRYQQPTDWGREEGETATVSLFHQFAHDITWNLRYRSVYHSDTARGFDVVSIRSNDLFVQRRARGQHNARTYNFGDTYVTVPFDTFGLSHKLVAGAQYGVEWDNLRRLQFYNAPPPPSALTADISIYDPDYSMTLPLSSYPTGSINDRIITSTDYGFYVNDLIAFSEHWKGMVGLRDARSKQKSVTYTPGKASKVSNYSGGDWLPMGGIIYQPNRQLSFYTSYSTSYVPQAAGKQDVNGNSNFPPMTADSVEVGTKDNFWNGRVNMTVALYRINESNVLNSFHCAIGTCSAPIGKERSQGAEFELDAVPLPGWQIAAGYSYTDAKVTGSNVTNQTGAELQNVPLNAFHVWSRYEFSGGHLAGLGAGLGLSYVDGRAGTLPTASSKAILQLPSYFVTDAALYYDFSHYALTVKVSNLFDERYYESAGFNGEINVLPGAPRTVTLSLEARF